MAAKGFDIYEKFDEYTTPVTESGCIIWLKAISKKGYGRATFNGRVVPAHRVSYILSEGEIPDGMIVCHSCDIPSCVNPNHLFLGTHKDNAQDAIKKGRHTCQNREGKEWPTAKLKDWQALEIINSNESTGVLAEKYGLCARSIRRIKTGLTWKHLQK